MADVPAELLSVLEHLDAPAILLTPDYEIIGANRAYRRKFLEQPVGRRCYQVSHRYSSPCHEHGELCPLQTSCSTGRSCRVLHVHHTRSGPEHVDVELRAVRDAAGTVTCYIEVMREVRSASAVARTASLLGNSRVFNATMGLVMRSAQSDVPVLLLGESGTGKELLAQAVHDQSQVASGPFVPVACSGLPEALFESEMFGHERGAFSGAHARKVGLVETAAGGTLFLDEIGDVPLKMQVKLLRLLESRSYRRVGGTAPLLAEFRLVCATHRDLRVMVREGSFREDLYYRISAFPIRVPALRERGDDVLLLASTFLEARGMHLSDAAKEQLVSYDFPGNVRELRNMVRRAELLCDGDLICAGDLFPDQPLSSPAPEGPARRWPWGDGLMTLKELERNYLKWVAESVDVDRRALAERLGVSERTLYRKLRLAGVSDRPL